MGGNIRVYRNGIKTTAQSINLKRIGRTNFTSEVKDILYDYIEVMKQRCENVSNSYWYKEENHGSVLSAYKERIKKLETQLIPIENIKANPVLAIESLLSIRMPKEVKPSEYEKHLSSCADELKELNNKNDSSILVWTYMVNGAYQKALNDITEYNNGEMESLNQLYSHWKSVMTELGNKVDREKSKLGLN